MKAAILLKVAEDEGLRDSIRDSEGGMALCTCVPKATVVIRVVGHALLEGKLYAVGGFG